MVENQENIESFNKPEGYKSRQQLRSVTEVLRGRGWRVDVSSWGTANIGHVWNVGTWPIQPGPQSELIIVTNSRLILGSDCLREMPSRKQI